MFTRKVMGRKRMTGVLQVRSEEEGIEREPGGYGERVTGMQQGRYYGGRKEGGRE